MTELWIKLSDTGWGYRPGHETAHFMLRSNVSTSPHWISACGQVAIIDPYNADTNLKKCGRCERTVAKHPEWEEKVTTGLWSSAIGSTKQHHWEEWYPLSVKWLSRCGVIRSKDEVGKMDAKTLAAVGVSDRIYIPDCQKCLDYLGIDERKRPDKTMLNDEGRTVSVKMMRGTKPGYYVGDISAENLKGVGRHSFELDLPGNEAVEEQRVRLPANEDGSVNIDLIENALISYTSHFFEDAYFLCIPSEDQDDK